MIFINYFTRNFSPRFSHRQTKLITAMLIFFLFCHFKYWCRLFTFSINNVTLLRFFRCKFLYCSRVVSDAINCFFALCTEGFRYPFSEQNNCKKTERNSPRFFHSKSFYRNTTVLNGQFFFNVQLRYWND